MNISREEVVQKILSATNLRERDLELLGAEDPSRDHDQGQVR